MRLSSLFVIIASVFLLVGFVVESHVILTIHDTYLVIARSHVSMTISILLFLCSLVYFALESYKRKASKGLGWAHLILTMIPCFEFFYLELFTPSIDRSMAGQSMSEEMENWAIINSWLSVGVMLGLLGQLLFLINVTRALIRGRRSS